LIEIARRLHQAKFAITDEAAGAIRQHEVDRQEVGLREELVFRNERRTDPRRIDRP
jgi:hypothetical protein